MADDQNPSQFSLFEGDLMNRAFSLLHIDARTPSHIFARFLVIFCITWVPMAALSWHTAMNLPQDAPYAQNFFYDFAAYAQFFVGIPLYLIAERVIGKSIMGAARDMETSGVVSDADKPALHKIENDIATLRRKLLPELILIFVSFYFAFMAFAPELVRTDAHMVTWHVYAIKPHEFLHFFMLTHWYTPAGMFATFVALPVQTYIWMRWVWKIYL